MLRALLIYWVGSCSGRGPAFHVLWLSRAANAYGGPTLHFRRVPAQDVAAIQPWWDSVMDSEGGRPRPPSRPLSQWQPALMRHLRFRDLLLPCSVWFLENPSAHLFAEDGQQTLYNQTTACHVLKSGLSAPSGEGRSLQIVRFALPLSVLLLLYRHRFGCTDGFSTSTRSRSQGMRFASQRAVTSGGSSLRSWLQ
jgi:hypothetical protein